MQILVTMSIFKRTDTLRSSVVDSFFFIILFSKHDRWRMQSQEDDKNMIEVHKVNNRLAENWHVNKIS